MNNMQEMLEMYQEALANAEQLHKDVAEASISAQGLIQIVNERRLHMFAQGDAQAQINNCRTVRQLKALVLTWTARNIEGCKWGIEAIQAKMEEEQSA